MTSDKNETKRMNKFKPLYLIPNTDLVFAR